MNTIWNTKLSQLSIAEGVCLDNRQRIGQLYGRKTALVEGGIADFLHVIRYLYLLQFLTFLEHIVRDALDVLRKFDTRQLFAIGKDTRTPIGNVIGQCDSRESCSIEGIVINTGDTCWDD